MLEKLKAQGDWWKWLIGAVLSIAGAGWAARGYIQSQADAEEQYQELLNRIDHSTEQVQNDNKAQAAVLSAQLSSHDQELEHLRYVNVRIEITQRQIGDQLVVLTTHTDETASPRERRNAAEAARRVEQRAEALERSFELVPAVPNSHPIPHGEADPLHEIGAM